MIPLMAKCLLLLRAPPAAVGAGVGYNIDVHVCMGSSTYVRESMMMKQGLERLCNVYRQGIINVASGYGFHLSRTTASLVLCRASSR